MFAPIQIMLQEDYNVITVGHPAVAVKLKVARPVAYTFTRTLRPRSHAAVMV